MTHSLILSLFLTQNKKKKDQDDVWLRSLEAPVPESAYIYC